MRWLAGARERGWALVELFRSRRRRDPEAAGQSGPPGHREIWLEDPDGYFVVIASPDEEARSARPSAGPSLSCR
jgi:hypothetical protein